jgi:hypothetical protein
MYLRYRKLDQASYRRYVGADPQYGRRGIPLHVSPRSPL